MKGLVETLRATLADIRNALRARSNEWILKRQGTDDSSVLLHRRRIYILPTRAGLLFAAVVLMLLIGSLNYANNMGFALTFLLTAVGLVAMHHCHGNLAGLSISFKQAKPVFAGDKAQFEFILDNNDALSRSQISAGLERTVLVCGDIRAENRAIFTLPLGNQQARLDCMSADRIKHYLPTRTISCLGLGAYGPACPRLSAAYGSTSNYFKNQQRTGPQRL